LTLINANLVRALDGNAPQYKKEGVEEFEPLEGKGGAPNFRVVDGHVEKEIIPITFGGERELVINDEKSYRSDNINIRTFSDIDVFVRNNVNSGGAAVDFYGRVDLTSSVDNMAFYDWNTEEWVRSFISDNSLTGPYVEIPNGLGILSLLTHPNFYWLKKSKLDMIRLRVRALKNPSGSNNTFEAWLVGEKNV